METETIDKLFLELSQVTRATTARESALTNALLNLYIAYDELEGNSDLDDDDRPEIRAMESAMLSAAELLWPSTGSE